MDLKQQKQSVLDELNGAIENGIEVKEKIELEYQTKRKDKSFDQDNDISRWSTWCNNWHNECMKKKVLEYNAIF